MDQDKQKDKTATETKPYHHGDLKSALVETAKKILREKGVDALSLRAIAAEVGVSHMAPYTHFKNKKELLQAIAASGYDDLTKRLLKIKDSYTSPWDLVYYYGVEYVQFAVENPATYRLMLSQADTSGRRNKKEDLADQGKVELSPLLEVSSQKPFNILKAAFQNGDADPEQVKARALSAWSLVHGMSALIIDGHIRIPESMTIGEFFRQAVSPKMMKV
jgi:AcrR family transcriptional regulator